MVVATPARQSAGYDPFPDSNSHILVLHCGF
jgi:hypothetical protein